MRWFPSLALLSSVGLDRPVLPSFGGLADPIVAKFFHVLAFSSYFLSPSPGLSIKSLVFNMQRQTASICLEA